MGGKPRKKPEHGPREVTTIEIHHGVSRGVDCLFTFSEMMKADHCCDCGRLCCPCFMEDEDLCIECAEDEEKQERYYRMSKAPLCQACDNECDEANPPRIENMRVVCTMCSNEEGFWRG